MRIVLYGVGNRYCELFNGNEFVEEELKKNSVEIVGIADGNKKGKKVLCGKNEVEVKSINEFKNIKFDYIVVTSNIFFDEIKRELVYEGYYESQIMLIDDLIELWLANIFNIEKFTNKNGIEVGGPSDIFSSIYFKCNVCDGVNFSSQTTWWEKDEGSDYKFKDKKLGEIFISDATDMSCVHGDKYDFILSSNNLEHIANPIRALKEFCRVVHKDGIVVVVVPMKEKNFDHKREYTTFEHLLEDYQNNTTESDLSHLDEIIEKHDYDKDIKCGGKEKFIERAKLNMYNRCLHHHVFNEKCLQELFNFVDLEIVELRKIMKDYLIIGVKK